MGTLYVVATPIGNLEDLSPRAVRVLREVALIAAEDTRHSRRLLTHFAIETPTVSYHEHNQRARRELLLEALASGDVALITDAGTPACLRPRGGPGHRRARRRVSSVSDSGTLRPGGRRQRLRVDRWSISDARILAQGARRAAAAGCPRRDDWIPARHIRIRAASRADPAGARGNSWRSASRDVARADQDP